MILQKSRLDAPAQLACAQIPHMRNFIRVLLEYLNRIDRYESLDIFRLFCFFLAFSWYKESPDLRWAGVEVEGSGSNYIIITASIFRTGVKRVIDGSVRLAGKTGQGKIRVKYLTSPLSTETDLVVLDTDYDNYAVVWSCSGFGPIHSGRKSFILSFKYISTFCIKERTFIHFIVWPLFSHDSKTIIL